MALQIKTPQRAVHIHLKNAIAQLENILIQKLSYIGMECIKLAREKGDYTDQTGNLRSSVGFVVLKNGRAVTESDFEVVKNGKEGSTQGKQFLNTVVEQYNKGIVLVVVAGMKYAAHVEARGYNVLSLSELKAKEMASQLLSILNQKQE